MTYTHDSSASAVVMMTVSTSVVLSPPRPHPADQERDAGGQAGVEQQARRSREWPDWSTASGPTARPRIATSRMPVAFRKTPAANRYQAAALAGRRWRIDTAIAAAARPAEAHLPQVMDPALAWKEQEDQDTDRRGDRERAEQPHPSCSLVIGLRLVMVHTSTVQHDLILFGNCPHVQRIVRTSPALRRRIGLIVSGQCRPGGRR